MLSLSIKHPDAEKFIDAKLKEGKITGANISVKITDEFMQAVKSDLYFTQTFPINVTEDIFFEGSDTASTSMKCKATGDDVELNKLYPGTKPNTYFRVIRAKELWDKIIKNAWKVAEPGVLFEDTILRESPADCYADKGFRTVSTNPCKLLCRA